MPQKKLSNLELNNNAYDVSRLRLHITGAVQGVGFRPFVFNLAQQLKLAGWVCNDIRGLRIEVEGDSQTLNQFIQRLQWEAPPVSEIKHIEQIVIDALGETEFCIAASENPPEVQPKPSVLPDLATCPECFKEISEPSNSRYRYPFTSCTLCGPRWSIIESLPYDRPNTSMDAFPFCPDCEKEYTNPADRRFHHQANTCPVCGPKLTLCDRSGAPLETHEEALQQALVALTHGQIIALKGIGGFQLLVDATNAEAVNELRQRKQRPAKPFALLCSDLKQIAQYCDTSKQEQDLLQSAAAPIVLLKKKSDSGLAASIAPGNPYLGVMLPCSVLHHLLAKDFAKPLVCTSGNLSGDPICKENEEALQRLQHVVDLFLLHDRPVVRALDDSVAQVIMGQPSLLRRARGYAPRPIEIKTKSGAPTVLAVGAHIKNTVALSLPSEENTTDIMLSAHLGDLNAPNTRAAFENRIEKYKELYRLSPELLVHDLHPDYYSTQYASSKKTRQLGVQHHWAHIAACMAEHQIKDQILGIAWDGVGLGDDGTAWGGEFLLADMHGFKRLGYLLPFALPGGDKAALDIRRAMLGVLFCAANGDAELLQQWVPEGIFKASELLSFTSMLQSGLNTIPTTSAGRLFDAVASLLDLSQQNSFEGEGAMALQFAAEAGSAGIAQQLPHLQQGNCTAIDWRPLIMQILEGLQKKQSVNDLARLFHQTLVKAIVDFVVTIQAGSVILTGGCFQNRLLLQLTVEALQQHQIKAYWPQQIPANDGGVAFGQAVIGINSI